MSATVVYMFEHPVWPRDWERFGVALSQERVAVEMWDLSPWLAPGLHRETPLKERLHSGNCSIVANLAELQRRLEALDPQTTLVIPLLGYQSLTWPIFRQLTRRRLAYGLSRTNFIPASSLPPGTAFWKRLLRVRPAKLVSLLLRKLPGRWVGVRPARFLFLGGARSGSPGPYGPLVDASTERVWVHQLDYELYLREQANPTQLSLPERYVVFLDEHVPYHWEFTARERPLPLSDREYHEDLNEFFSLVERVTGLPVVIAEHPNADYSGKNPFGGRPVIRKQSVAAVRGSSLVLAHASTALGYAALYAKPVALLMHPKFAGTEFAAMIQTMARALDRQPLDMSRPDEATFVRQHQAPLAALARYREDYVKRAGSSNRVWGELMADCALNL